MNEKTILANTGIDTGTDTFANCLRIAHHPNAYDNTHRDG
jgi:hypothetical protein